MLADASHELRTPVTALLGNVEYAARHGADAEVMAELRHDTLRLARLVDSLLALERVEAAAAASSSRCVSTTSCAQTVDAQDPGRVHLGGLDVVTVNGDDDALRRALGNLIENGLVHGPRGGGVTVWLERSDGQGAAQRGGRGGGPGSRRARPAVRALLAGQGAAERPGSGLGLSIVAAIAERHGGRVVVDGSTFTLELPRLQPEPPAA